MKKFTKVLAFAMCLVMLMSTCSALVFNAYAVSAPKFTLEETSKNGNVVTYEFKLQSGGFNAIDFNFEATGAYCTSIVFADGVAGGIANPANASVSYANVQTYSKSGTIVTATFVIASDSYKIDARVTNCCVTDSQNVNTDVTRSVTVNDKGSESIFIKIIRFIIKVIDFIINLFSGSIA